jgi:hypothetical protein
MIPMESRRRFMQGGVATAATLMAHGCGASMHALASMRADEDGKSSFHGVLYEEASPDAVLFAQEAQRRGAVTHAIRGDVSGVWLSGLARATAPSSMTIAGMTHPLSMFMVGIMACNAHVRLMYRGTHLVSTEGEADHRCEGPAEWLSRQPTLVGAHWALTAARTVMSWRTPRSGFGEWRGIRPSDWEGIDPRALVSWIIAPVSRMAAAPAVGSRRSILAGWRS